jgi:mannose-6-phosphate isomerase-like protein (cupin superfamily)
MAKKGQTIANKKTGEKLTWLETSKDTNGKYLKFDFEVSPKGKLPVVHFHPNQSETFSIKSGTLTIKQKGQIVVLKPGDSITIEKGVPHQWWNDSVSEPAKLVVTFEPALNTEVFLEQFFGLGNDNKTKADGTPNFLQIMAMANAYEIYVAGPPLTIQKVMGFVLGGIARIIGYKKYYPKYSQ